MPICCCIKNLLILTSMLKSLLCLTTTRHIPELSKTTVADATLTIILKKKSLVAYKTTIIILCGFSIYHVWVRVCMHVCVRVCMHVCARVRLYVRVFRHMRYMCVAPAHVNLYSVYVQCASTQRDTPIICTDWLRHLLTADLVSQDKILSAVRNRPEQTRAVVCVVY